MDDATKKTVMIVAAIVIIAISVVFGVRKFSQSTSVDSNAVQSEVKNATAAASSAATPEPPPGGTSAPATAMLPGSKGKR